MGARFHGRTSRPSTGEQAAWIRARWGDTWEVLRARPDLVARGQVQPTEMMQVYTVRLEFDGWTPSVRVLDPPLRPRPDAEEIPHMYEQERLCLYYPQYREWTPADLLSDTIIPWTARWLFHYEVWHAVGEWHGGGIH